MATPGNLPEILTNCRFYLELTLDKKIAPDKKPVLEGADAYFMECRGFKTTQDIVEFCEVTAQKWAQAKHGNVVRTKVPGNVKTNNIVLKRGMTQSMELWNWFKDVQQGKWSQQRRSGSLNIYSQDGKIHARFEFSGAFPASYTLADVNSAGSDVEIEEMELACEELVRSQ